MIYFPASGNVHRTIPCPLCPRDTIYRSAAGQKSTALHQTGALMSFFLKPKATPYALYCSCKYACKFCNAFAKGANSGEGVTPSLRNKCREWVYYRGELSGKKRILKALSNYIKGEIDVGLFANAYHKILCEEYAKSQNPWNITPEGLAAAGIGSE